MMPESQAGQRGCPLTVSSRPFVPVTSSTCGLRLLAPVHTAGSWCLHSLKHSEYILMEKTWSHVCHIERHSFFGEFWCTWRVISLRESSPVSTVSQTRECAACDQGSGSACGSGGSCGPWQADPPLWGWHCGPRPAEAAQHVLFPPPSNALSQWDFS